MIWHRKVQAQTKSPFLNFSNHVDGFVQIGTGVFDLAKVLSSLAAHMTKTALGMDRRSHDGSILHQESNGDLYKINGLRLKRKMIDGTKIIESILKNEKKVEITNIPFESNIADKEYHPQGNNIKENIVLILEGLLKAYRFTEDQLETFRFILHESLINTRKYQTIALKILEDNPETIKKNLYSAIKEVIDRELSGKLDEGQKVSLLIERSPEYIIFTIYSPLISEPKLKNIFHSMTHLAKKDSFDIASEVQNTAECSGQGISLILKVLNADIPESLYYIYNDEQGRGFTKIMLKKPVAQTQDMDQEAIAS